jgi:hypothetical protein
MNVFDVPIRPKRQKMSVKNYVFFCSDKANSPKRPPSSPRILTTSHTHKNQTNRVSLGLKGQSEGWWSNGVGYF